MVLHDKKERTCIAPPTAELGIASPFTVSQYRVLVVDDNEPAAQGMARLLSIKGYFADAAYSGKEAEEKMKSFRPHAIVLDIGLPDTDGYTLARQLRAQQFAGPLIALTGYGQDENKKQAFDAGFNSHLTKPVGIADLEAALAESL